MFRELLFLAVMCAGSCLRRAIAKENLSIKEAAGCMGIGAAQLSRQLTGGESVSLSRVARLPRAVRQWFAVELAMDEGLPREVRLGQRLRMARARLHSVLARSERKHA